MNSGFHAQSGGRIPTSAYSAYIEAVLVQPNPDPATGAGSTELSAPRSLKDLQLDVLLADATDTPVVDSFTDVLARRRSVREYGPLSATGLVRLLDMVFALQWSAPADDGGTRRFRPVPSAGGRHPVAPLVLNEDVDQLDAGLWRFDPDARRLCLVAAAGDRAVDRAWRAVCAAGTFKRRPPAVIVLAAKFDATLVRYPAGCALVWRDAGVALGTIHLAATHLGLASCILGTAGVLDGDLLEACGIVGDLVGDVGCLAVGGPRVAKYQRNEPE